MPQPTKTWYGGRFRMELPVGLTLRGEGGYVKGVELRGVTLPAAPTSAAARDAFWKQHVAEVRQEYRSHKLPPILDEGTLRPGVPKLSYRGYDEDDLAFEALLTDDERRAVLVIALWRQSYKPEDRPAQNAERERAWSEVVNAFSFLAPGPIASAADVFHVAGGVVRLPYSASDVDHQETFGIGFDGATHWMKLDFEYVYVKARSDDKQPGFLARVAHTVAEWPVVGRSIRSGKRTVAGFSGEESLLHSTDDHTIRYGWMYDPAKDQPGFQPTIKISGESDDGDTALTTGVWDQALAGIRRLGP